MDIKKTQEEIIANKIKHGFNTTDMYYEFCLLNGEVAEAVDAYNKKKPKEELGSELADVAIYLLGISELLGFNLEDEITKKMKINANRVYKKVNGVNIKVNDENKD